MHATLGLPPSDNIDGSGGKPNMTVKNIRVDPTEIKQVQSKGKAAGAGNFDAFLGAVDAMAPLNTELMYQATGSSNAAAVLHGAFTGVSGAAGAYGVGSGASSASYGGFGALGEYPGMMGVGSSGTYTGMAVSGGSYKAASGGLASSDATTGLPTGELIGSMNTNNLKLLELQAVMQSNMQSWNTKSNILSADHRARMAMIEKFSARG